MPQRTDYRLLQRDYLLQIARAINSRLDLDEVLALVIRHAVQFIGGRAGAIALRQLGGYEIAASYRLDEPHIDLLKPLLEHIPEWARAGAPALWENPSGRWGFDQIVALPLTGRSNLVGVLFVFRPFEARLFTPLDAQLLRAFADQASIAVENSNLYTLLAAQTQSLRLLHDFAVDLLRIPDLRQVFSRTATCILGNGVYEWVAIIPGPRLAALGHRAVAGGTVEGKPEVVLEELHELTDTVAKEDKPVTFSSGTHAGPALDAFWAEGFQSLRAIPIQGATERWGTLWAASRSIVVEEPRALRFLETVTGYLGLATDKFQLIERLAVRERQLGTIVGHSSAGVFLLDGDCFVALYNPVAAKLVGRAPVEDERVPLREILQLEDEHNHPIPLPLPETNQSTTVQGYLRRRDGTRGNYVQVGVTPVRSDEEGQVEGYVVNITDLTALHEAAQAKSVFLAGLSHELKTPLSLIRGYAETLRYPQAREDDSLYTDSLNIIVEETEHLTAMVNQMLLAARLQAGALPLDRDEVALGPFLRKLVRVFEQRYPEYRWEYRPEAHLPTIVADPARLREVFQNLLSNAVKYSSTGSTIRLTVHATEQGVRVAVSDEGIGIAAADQSKLFERFYRASDHAEGTGLGLYLSRAIVEAHGGAITVESEPGKGSTFFVDLPRTQLLESGSTRPGQTRGGSGDA